ncbi:hypothetical protein ACF0H5_012216 [Mactra antiquata]
MELTPSASECSSPQSETDWDSGSHTSDDELIASGNLNRSSAFEIHGETAKTDGAHNCLKNKNIIHRACGSLCDSEASGSLLLCMLCKSAECINSERISAGNAIITKSERMLDSTNKVLQDVDEGTNVLIPIPKLTVEKLIQKMCWQWLHQDRKMVIDLP